jgi:hypothetical protein
MFLNVAAYDVAKRGKVNGFRDVIRKAHLLALFSNVAHDIG